MGINKLSILVGEDKTWSFNGSLATRSLEGTDPEGEPGLGEGPDLATVASIREAVAAAGFSSDLSGDCILYSERPTTALVSSFL